MKKNWYILAGSESRSARNDVDVMPVVVPGVTDAAEESNSLCEVLYSRSSHNLGIRSIFTERHDRFIHLSCQPF